MKMGHSPELDHMLRHKTYTHIVSIIEIIAIAFSDHERNEINVNHK